MIVNILNDFLQIVIESGIIPEYLDGIYPESAILPTDPYLRAKQRILLEQAAPVSELRFFNRNFDISRIIKDLKRTQ